MVWYDRYGMDGKHNGQTLMMASILIDDGGSIFDGYQKGLEKTGSLCPSYLNIKMIFEIIFK